MRLRRLSQVSSSPITKNAYPIRHFSCNSDTNQYFRSRQQHLKEAQGEEYDVIIIGGGCNGVGTFLDATTRGLKVLLLQKDDFGSGTSSKSTKLFHGGVRYLEQVFEFSRMSWASRMEKFKLVKQAIVERGSALRNYNYLSKKIPFIIPCRSRFRLMYYWLGSLFYYLIYRVEVPKNSPKFLSPTIISKTQLKKRYPLISDQFVGGVIYEDGCFNDARLLIMTLLTASQTNCEYNNGVRSLKNKVGKGNFINRAQVLKFLKDEKDQINGVTFYDKVNQRQHTVKGKYVVNCTGAWSDYVRKIDYQKRSAKIIMVGGSHLTYDSRIASSQYGLCMPSKDGRVILIVPWLNRIIVGTTEVTFFEPTNHPTIIESEREFLREAVEETMNSVSYSQIRNSEITHWTGLRPLVVDGSGGKDTKKISRDFVIEESKSGLWSLMGGKWTIFRKMGQDMMNKIAEKEKAKGVTIAKSCTLQLSVLGVSDNEFRQKFIKQYGQVGRYLYENYGTLAQQVTKGDLTILYGNVTRAQIEWICRNEMVEEVEDVLMRRTRILFTQGKQVGLQLVPEIARIMGRVRGLTESEISDLVIKGVASIESYDF